MNAIQVVSSNDKSGTRKVPALLYCLFALICYFSPAKGQNMFMYNQYMHNLVPFNQAASLMDSAGAISSTYRQQSTGISGAPSTFIFNGQLPLEQIGAATGIFIFNDQFAIERLTEVNAFFAKRVQLAQNQYLAVSLNAGVRRYVAAYSDLDAFDPQFRNDVRELRPNIGFSVLYYSDRYYLGISVPEFTVRSLGTASAVNNNYFTSRYNFSAAYLTGNDDDDIRLKPAALATYSKGSTFIANLSATVYLKNTLALGGNYRTGGEMAGILSYLGETFSLGYSYQFSNSNPTGYSFRPSTHEVSLSYRFRRGDSGKRPLL